MVADVRRWRVERGRNRGAASSRGWRGHFFVVSDLLGRPGFMRREDVRAVSEMGHVVGSHSSSHPPRMSECPWSELLEEWRDSIELVSEVIGARVTSAACREVTTPPKWAGRRPHAACGALSSRPVSRVGAVDGCLLLGATRSGVTRQPPKPRRRPAGRRPLGAPAHRVGAARRRQARRRRFLRTPAGPAPRLIVSPGPRQRVLDGIR